MWGEERGRHWRPQGEERRKGWERREGEEREEVEKRKGRGGGGEREGCREEQRIRGLQ